MGVEIATDRIILRNFEKRDLQDLYEYCRQDGVGELAGWPHHDSIKQSTKFLDDFILNKNQFAIVYKETNKVIGHICVHKDSENSRNDTKELGYVLNHDYWNRGIMTEVLFAILEYLFSNNICYVYACCFQNNRASKHLIEKCGFTFEQEGTFYAKPLDKTFSTFEYVYIRNDRT
jgi:ribosomal-protein-alanine N-acetyltransferase